MCLRSKNKYAGMKKSLHFCFKCLFSLVYAFVLFEIGLRLFPGLIPLNLLILFNEGPRVEIARRRELPTKDWDTVVVERDDGGPELRIYKPFTRLTWTVGTYETVVMDEMGFCNLPQNSYQLPTIDIITLGDSFTACHAVTPQDTWSSQLSMLTGLSVYNLGRVKIGIHEYIQLLKKFGLQKSPRIVILNVYEGNDFRDARRYYRAVNKNAAQSDATFVDNISSPLPPKSNFIGSDWLERHSYAFNLFLSLLSYADQTYFNPPPPNELEKINFKYRFVFLDEISIPFNSENVDRDEVQSARYMTTLQTSSEVLDAIEDALKTFVDLSEQYDFVPVVTYTPSAHTAYVEYVVFDDPNLTGLMPSFSHEQRQYLNAKSKELGYVFIDFTPSLQAAAQANGPQKLLYYPLDLHLTPAGHAAVANILNQALNDLGILARRGE